jgi:phage terminase large subunit GpA-like protein
VREKGRTVLKWDLQEGARNEALDCRVYAMSMIDILQIDLNQLAAQNILLSNQQTQKKKKKVRRRIHVTNF